MKRLKVLVVVGIILFIWGSLELQALEQKKLLVEPEELGVVFTTKQEVLVMRTFLADKFGLEFQIFEQRMLKQLRAAGYDY